MYVECQYSNFIPCIESYFVCIFRTEKLKVEDQSRNPSFGVSRVSITYSAEIGVKSIAPTRIYYVSACLIRSP